MKKIIAITSMAAAIMLAGSTIALAAANPSGTGQPSQSCGSATAIQSPNGFNTSGFANAAAHYAGSAGTPSLANAQSSNAVSQYDVACFQVSQSH